MLRKHKMVISLFFVAGVILFSVSAFAATLTTITIKEMDGVSTAAYPLTFGHVFKKGDVTGNVYLNSYPTQTDVKATWPDGSIRHAVISALVPIAANSDLVLNINDTGTAASATPMNKTEILETDVGATIDLTGVSGSGYSGNLQADLRAQIDAASSLDYWLDGGVVSEILIDQRLNNSLNATWEARFYPGTPYIRISHAMENVEANYRGNINYALTINQGNASLSQVFSKAEFTHHLNSRWRKVYWLGSEPPEVEIHYDINYLMSTGHIPSYDTSLAISESTISGQKAAWDSSDNDIFGTSGYAGFANKEFSTTGGRPEIGLLPKWTALYLLTFDNRMKEITLGHSQLFANAPIHYREYDPAMSFYNQPVSIDDRDVWLDEYRISTGYSGGLPPLIGDDSSGWSVDRAHQGSYSYIPYLVTGEKFHLDEMEWWAAYNLGASNPGYREYSTGIIRDQVRGEAWAIRNITHPAVLGVDGSQMKAYLAEKVNNNLSHWAIEDSSVEHPLKYWGIATYSEGRTQGVDSTVKLIVSGWMHDFVVITLKHMSDLGFDVSSVLPAAASFTINRFTHPDFNPYLGDAYQFPAIIYGDPDTEVQTWSEANSKYTSQPSSFDPIGYAYSYWHIAAAALSQVVDQTNGQTAYDWLLANWNTSSVPTLTEQYEADPTWAIVPGSNITSDGEGVLSPPQSLEIQ